MPGPRKSASSSVNKAAKQIALKGKLLPTANATTATEQKRNAAAQSNVRTNPKLGKIVAVDGGYVVVQFEDELPSLLNALEVENRAPRLVLEVDQQLGGSIYLTIASGDTGGLIRGQNVMDTGEPITIPMGPVNLVGKTTATHRPIRRKVSGINCKASVHTELSLEQGILETRSRARKGDELYPNTIQDRMTRRPASPRDKTYHCILYLCAVFAIYLYFQLPLQIEQSYSSPPPV